jgi:acyl-CoA synthetase (NDP forming)
LEAYGLKFPKTVLAESKEEAEKYFMEFKGSGINEFYLKIESPDIIHKSDAGCVKKAVMMSEDTELMQTYDEIINNAKKYNPDAIIKGVLIQEFVDGGKEVLVGVKHEKGIGHLIGFGEGGIYTEARKDISFSLAPLSVEEANTLMESVKFYKILKGVRGEKAVCFCKLALALLRISKLVSDFPQIEEIDINPIKAFYDKIICVDARMKVS